MSLLAKTNEGSFEFAHCVVSVSPIVEAPITICTEVTQTDADVLPAGKLLQCQGVLHFGNLSQESSARLAS
jgi:hypothetical protein